MPFVFGKDFELIFNCKKLTPKFLKLNGFLSNVPSKAVVSMKKIGLVEALFLYKLLRKIYSKHGVLQKALGLFVLKDI
jgi:hypothetical protein